MVATRSIARVRSEAARDRETQQEIAAALSLLAKAPVETMLPQRGASVSPDADAHLAALAAVYAGALRDFRASKRAVATAVAEGAPASTVEGLDRVANVLDALQRRAFEDALMLAAHVRDLPPFVRERTGLLAAVVRHNRAAHPGDMGVEPAFAVHALRCARWVVALDAHGAARIMPSCVVPAVRVVLWDHELV
jgi:hypothetical protein